MKMSTKRKKTIHVAAKEIVCHVIDVCDAEAVTGELRFSVNRKQRRVCDYTGISRSTITRIKKECREAGQSKLLTPGKRRACRLGHVANLDYFSVRVVRDVISDFYLTKEGDVTSTKLLEAIKEKVDFPGSLHVLRRLLEDMGFKWKTCKKNRYRLLVEDPHNILWRFRYLKSITKAREENKNIIYLSQTWVDNSFSLKKCWYSTVNTSNEATLKSTNRLIILHACQETGFIENAQLIFKAIERNEDYDTDMNYRMYEMWLAENVLPNIPENSVLVLDSSPYNSVERNKIPSKYTTKATMISWLEKNGVSVSPDKCKGEIYSLIAKYKKSGKIYCIDEMLKTEGHTVLRLPPLMFDLNPLEFVWEKVESKIGQKSLRADCPSDLKMAVIEAINSITAEDWQRFHSEIIRTENKYSRIDEAMEVEMDKLLVHMLHPDSSESTSESEPEVVNL